ncbi:MAG: DUF2125 domain-containing protein [Rhodobacteraceae bacterium]|nr:DUF2125 domain-containing protein [Paracoccaceae bacterium]
MRIVIRILLGIAVVWSLYWFGVGYAARLGISQWFAARTDEGWQAEFSGISTTGYPVALITTLAHPVLAAPQTGISWRADTLTFDSPAAWPGAVSLRFADTPQQLSYLNQTITLTTADMVADLRLKPGPALELHRLALTVGPWRFDQMDVPLLSGDDLILAVEQQESPEVYTIEVSSRDFAPGDLARRALPGTDRWPQGFAALQIQATMRFDRIWDRRALEAERPQLRGIQLRIAEAQWGDLRILAEDGDFMVDSAGLPTGTITVKVDNWQQMLDIVEASGELPVGLRDSAERSLRLLAGLGGDLNTLDVQLNFANGYMSLGPIPLGPAPRIVLH